MTRIEVWVAGLLLLIAAVASAQVGKATERRFTLPDHGSFVIHVPVDWKEQLRQPPDRLPPTITFAPGSGQPFQVLLTTIWPATKDRAPQSRDQLRAMVERSAQSAKAQAVERDVPVVEFQGRTGPGFYFSATDRAPKPGEFDSLTQGIVRVGELSVTFTILTNKGQDRIVKQAIEALKGAVQDRRV
jgi:hypothetical protein